MFRKSHTGITIAGLFAAMSVFAATGAQAQVNPATTTFNVTATVVASCSVTATDMAFGNYDPLAGTPTDQTSTVAVTCTNSTPYTISLSDGLAGGSAPRTMDDDTTGTVFLNYNLFTDGTFGTVWNATNTVTGTGTGSAVNHTVHGRIPISQTVTPDTYADQITVSVAY